MAINSSTTIAIVLLTMCCANPAYAEGLEVCSDFRLVSESDSSRLIGPFPALWASDLGINGLHRSKVLEVTKALQLSNLQLNSYDYLRCCGPPEVSVFKTQSGLSETVEIKGSRSESEADRLIEVSELGPHPLFITEAMKKGPHSIPESLTLLFIGLVLVGLAGYGGRKKFKR